MHLAACCFFTLLTALMHLYDAFPKCIQLHGIFLVHTRKRYHWELWIGSLSHTPWKSKAAILKEVLFSDNILTTVGYRKYLRINIGIQAHVIYLYVEQQPVTGIPIQLVMRKNKQFRKTPKQFFFYTNLPSIFLCVCKHCKDIKHTNNFSRCIKTIENIIDTIICKINYH